MTAVRMLFVVIALGLSACHKLPGIQTSTRSHPANSDLVKAHGMADKAHAVAVGFAEPPKAVIDRNARVIVLGYHRFVEKVRRPDTEITPADFEKQMQALKDDGATVIPLKQFLAWRRGENNIPARSAIITIDDGYNSAYDVAWPILKKFGYPFTLFIYTDYVKGGPKSGGGSLTWAQLEEMRDAGVGIQSHTVSHGDLRGRHLKTKGRDYEAWLWNELHGSKEMLEQKLGIQITALAVPYGYYDDHVKEMAAKAGYDMLFTVNGEKLTSDTPMNALGRYMIASNQPRIFASAVNFGARNGAGSVAEAISAQWFDPLPADGATIAESKPLIRASLGELGEIHPGTVTLRLSGIGLLPAKYDAGTKTISYQFAKPLNPGAYTGIVSAQVDERKLEGHWKFTVDPSVQPALAGSFPKD